MKKKIAMKQEQERDKERGPFSAGEQLIFLLWGDGHFLDSCYIVQSEFFLVSIDERKFSAFSSPLFQLSVCFLFI